MKFINSIPASLWPNFKCDTIGMPILHTTNIVVPLEADIDKYSIEDKTRLNYHYLVGLSVSIPESTAQKITPILTCASKAVIATSKLDLRDDTDFVAENLPLLKILEANENGYIWTGYNGMVNIAESILKNVDAGAITADTAIEIIVHYFKFKGRKLSAI